MRTSYWSLTGPRQFDLASSEIRIETDTTVLLRFVACGLCGSDLSTYEGRRQSPYPISLGHEFVAVVEQAGDAATFTRGDIVVSDLNYRCGQCSQCQRGMSHLCETGQRGGFSNRAFGTYAVIESAYLTRVPSGEPRLEYSLAEPLSCVRHAFLHGDLRGTERVLMIGAGSLGLCMAMVMEEAEQCFDFLEIQSERAARLNQVCSWASNINTVQGEYDVVFDLSGSLAGLRMATESVRRGGRLVSMSHLDGYGDADFLLAALTRKDVWFIVSYLNGDEAPMARALDVIDKVWSESWNTLLSEKPLSDVPSTFASRRSEAANKTIFLIGD